MRAIVRLLLPLAVLGAVLAGCGLTGQIKPNQAPETTLFVSGDVDTVNHVVHLHWFGSDVDGTVTGYEIRLLNPAQPADTEWVFTLRADSVLTVNAPTGFTAPVFQARAIDNDGVRDPSPAVQDFRFRNLPPTVTLSSKPATTDTTFASVTVTWIAGDIDGNLSRMKYFVWLDGQAATPESTTSLTFTMPSARFFNGAATYNNGFRTLYVQGRDDGGRYGNIDSVRWFVRRPVAGSRARLLIIDDVPTTNTSNVRFDSLYINCATRNLPADQFAIMRLQNRTPFRSPMDVQQTFQQFETVIWYRANETSFSTFLHDFQSGIEGYLDHGGKFYLEGLYLLEGRNATGALTPNFITDYLDCRGLQNAYVITPSVSDSSAGWGNTNNSRFRSSVLADSSRQQALAGRTGEPGGTRAFLVRDNSKAILWAFANSLAPAAQDSIPVAVMNDRPGGGRVIVTTMPFSTSIPAIGGRGPSLIAKTFGLLGLLTP
ncbi:MAG: hypothetical protein HZA61_03575 [Candidatus Eisenbacteria bacterium]|uniref:Uncharacterized protein n=1 Tax=Eiseniibacteriota bacterium TaxID=2212470 RepID=A0A933SDP6_UNCEI|nr:hypothetical protein [Candidatus Eisenbacteria bacterium]